MTEYDCSKCGMLLTAAEQEGGLCPNCGTRLGAGGEQSSVRVDQLKPPRRADYPAPSQDAGRWQAVRGGLNLILGAISLGIVIGLLSFCLVFWALVGRAKAAPATPGDTRLLIVGFLLGLGALIAGILSLVGHIRCCAAPQRSGARGLALGTVACMALTIAFSCLGVAAEVERSFGRDPFRQPGGLVGLLLSGLGSVASVIGSILFLFFLRAVARFHDNKRLARSCMGFLIFAALLLVSLPVVVLLLWSTASLSGDIGPDSFGKGGRGLGQVFIPGAVILGVALLGTVAWYLHLLIETRNTLDEFM